MHTYLQIRSRSGTILYSVKIPEDWTVQKTVDIANELVSLGILARVILE